MGHRRRRARARARSGNIPLQVDANAAYSLDDAALLARLDPFDLLLIEQPLDYDDVMDHAVLQKQITTPVCLDESIHTVRIARDAIEAKACQIINIKPGRVGGHQASIELHDLCAAHGIPVWHGGMLESGIGRAHNIHLASLPNFTPAGRHRRQQALLPARPYRSGDRYRARWDNSGAHRTGDWCEYRERAYR